MQESNQLNHIEMNTFARINRNNPLVIEVNFPLFEWGEVAEKQQTLDEYKILAAVNGYRPTKVLVYGVYSVSNESFEHYTSEFFLNEIPRIQDFGGSKTHKGDFLSGGIILLNAETNKWIWCDSWGVHDYARNVGLNPADSAELFDYIPEETQEDIAADKMYADLIQNPEKVEQVAKVLTFPGVSAVETDVAALEVNKTEVIVNDNGKKVEFSNAHTQVTFSYRDKEFTGRCLRDRNNEPMFFSKTKRSWKKALAALKREFHGAMHMSDVIDILVKNNTRCHRWCSMD